LLQLRPGLLDIPRLEVRQSQLVACPGRLRLELQDSLKLLDRLVDFSLDAMNPAAEEMTFQIPRILLQDDAEGPVSLGQVAFDEGDLGNAPPRGQVVRGLLRHLPQELLGLVAPARCEKLGELERSL